MSLSIVNGATLPLLPKIDDVVGVQIRTYVFGRKNYGGQRTRQLYARLRISPTYDGRISLLHHLIFGLF